MIDVRAANLIPSRATTPAQARGLVALDPDLDAAVGTVLDPAREAESARLLLGVPAEADALDQSLDEDVPRDRHRARGYRDRPRGYLSAPRAP